MISETPGPIIAPAGEGLTVMVNGIYKRLPLRRPLARQLILEVRRDRVRHRRGMRGRSNSANAPMMRYGELA